MVRHVENLKRLYEREHQELEETRRVLQENRLMGDQPLNNRGLAGLALGGGKVSAWDIHVPHIGKKSFFSRVLSVHMCKRHLLNSQLMHWHCI